MAVTNDDRNKQNINLAQFPRRLDKSTLAQIMMQYDHHELHNGKHFTSSDSWQNVDTGAAPSVGLVFYMPDTSDAYAHLLFNVNVSKGALVQLYEDASAPQGDPAIFFIHPKYNNRRPSANTAEMLVGTGNPATISSVVGGTLIYENILGAVGTNPSAGNSPGATDRGSEWILKRNAVVGAPSAQPCYFLKVTTLADANNIAAKLDWYEHEDKY